MSKSIYLCICMGRAAIAATCRTSQIFYCNLECLDCRCSSSTEKRFCSFFCLQEPCLCRPLEFPRLYCTTPQRNLIWRIIVQDFEDIHCHLLWLFSYNTGEKGNTGEKQVSWWVVAQNFGVTWQRGPSSHMRYGNGQYGPSLNMICRVDDLQCAFVLAYTLFALNKTPAEDRKQPER